MQHLGLFEGIGGFSLAARWMGWRTVAWCENNAFCQKVLKYHFPNATAHGDITTTDFSPYRGRVDVLTGGFPCQPYSLAGDQLGDQDERHLWPHMLRAIREIRPRWVVGENVSGLVGWNGGLVFDQVHLDLEAEGYEVRAFLLPACAVDAEHRRERVFFVAYAAEYGVQGHDMEPVQGEPYVQVSPGRGGAENVRVRPGKSEYFHSGVSNGIPTELYNNCLAAYGNAVVPQVVYEIFKTIEQYEILS